MRVLRARKVTGRESQRATFLQPFKTPNDLSGKVARHKLSLFPEVLAKTTALVGSGKVDAASQRARSRLTRPWTALRTIQRLPQLARKPRMISATVTTWVSSAK